MTNASPTLGYRSLAVATALIAAGLLGPPALASADPMCESYEFAGALNFHQSDNWDVQIPARASSSTDG